jgi:hypothetical protein
MTTTRRALLPAVACTALLALAAGLLAQDLRLPDKGKVKFAVIGDMGTASREQAEVGHQMALFHQKLAFPFVITLGDNLYGGATSPDDFRTKFEEPYKELLAAGVKFYASLGNHDEPAEKNYKLFNMNGRRYYTFRESGARFFALDSNYMDAEQLQWLEKELSASTSDWKIAYFHHPLYSSGRTHGSSLDLRKSLEPLFVKYGVNVVFSGHDHIYERMKPQQGITYFVSGSAGALRKGDYGQPQSFSAAGFAADYHFMLVEIDGTRMHFQAISRTGATIDSGTIEKPPAP